MNHKNNMLALSQERFSARKFTPEAVSQEDLDYYGVCALGTIGSEQAALALAHRALGRGEEETAGVL